MSAPEIVGEPRIRQEGSSVFLEVETKNADEKTAVWTKDDKKLETPDSYKIGSTNKEGNVVFFNEVLNFDKPLAGTYKVEFSNAHGKNYATFNVAAGNAPEFSDKPHIAQRDGGQVIVIKCRGKSKLEITCEWLKNDQPVVFNDRVKCVTAKDNKDAEAYQYNLEIYGPQQEDEGKYTCVLKNAEGQNSQSLNLAFS